MLGLAGWRYSLDLITDDDVLDVISRQKELNFTPGAEYVYCNTGFTLLAQIVKRVSGESLREFTLKRIFQPLGMKSTHFRDDHAEIVKHIAYGYVDGEGGENSYRLSVTNFDTVGATSLLTTVEDLSHWDENFYHPKVGGPAFLKQQLEARQAQQRQVDPLCIRTVARKVSGTSHRWSRWCGRGLSGRLPALSRTALCRGLPLQQGRNQPW